MKFNGSNNCDDKMLIKNILIKNISQLTMLHIFRKSAEYKNYIWYLNECNKNAKKRVIL